MIRLYVIFKFITIEHYSLEYKKMCTNILSNNGMHLMRYNIDCLGVCMVATEALRREEMRSTVILNVCTYSVVITIQTQCTDTIILSLHTQLLPNNFLTCT